MMISCYSSTVEINALSNSNSAANHAECRLAFMYQLMESHVYFTRYRLQGSNEMLYEVSEISNAYFFPSTSWLNKGFLFCFILFSYLYRNIFFININMLLFQPINKNNKRLSWLSTSLHLWTVKLNKNIYVHFICNSSLSSFSCVHPK